MKPTDTEMSPLMEDHTVYWVDVRYGKDRDWSPLFTYSDVPAARKMRDHFNGTKRQPDYPLHIGGITTARVRTVQVIVTIEP